MVREDLVQRLLEYKQYRDAAAVLEDRARLWEARSPRQHVATDATADGPAEVTIGDVHVWDLVGAMARVLRKREQRRPRQIVHDDTPLEVHAARVESLVAAQGRVAFSGLFDDEMPRSRVVGIFLAVLELVRRGRLVTLLSRVRRRLRAAGLRADLVRADGAGAIAQAVRSVWPVLPGPSLPQPFSFRCEWHLRRNARNAMNAHRMGGAGSYHGRRLSTAFLRPEGWDEFRRRTSVFAEVRNWVAANNAQGRELWLTDGTVAGTGLLKDLNPWATQTFGTSSAPSGIRAIRRRAALRSASAKRSRNMASARGSSPMPTPKARATASAVMSSWVGPIPPVTKT